MHVSLVTRLPLAVVVGAIGAIVIARPVLFFHVVMFGRRWLQRSDSGPSDLALRFGRCVGLALVVIAMGIVVGLVPLSAAR